VPPVERARHILEAELQEVDDVRHRTDDADQADDEEPELTFEEVPGIDVVDGELLPRTE
jgi:hypothetical protein